MAIEFKAIFGGYSNKLYTQIEYFVIFLFMFTDKLIVDFLNDSENEFPSPKDLEGRIILKVCLLKRINK